MMPIGYKVFAVVAGGVLAGTLGAMHVNPVPKEPEAQWWQLTGRSDIAVDRSASGPWFEAAPEDLYVPRQDGFPPDWAADGELWQYPEPQFAEWEYEPYPTMAELDAQLAADAALLDEGSDGARTAADEAAAAAADAQLAQAPAEPEPAPGDVRKSELAVAGLY